jgi:hypothetical protein
MIGIVIDENAQKSKEEYSDANKCVNGRSLLRQVKGMGRVDRWDPNKTSPANVISGTIVLNVHTAHVSHFPVKEFGNVDKLERHIDGHAELQRVTVELHIFVRKAQNSHGPKHHAGTAVGKHFDVPSEYARIEFHAPIVIHNDTAVASRIGGTGCDVALDEQHGTKQERKDIHAAQNISKLVKHQCRIKVSKVGSKE